MEDELLVIQKSESAIWAKIGQLEKKKARNKPGGKFSRLSSISKILPTS